jgi:GTPase
VRVHDDFLDESVATPAVGVGEAVKQRVLSRTLDFVDQVAPFLVAEGLAVRDEKLQVACVGRIHMRKIDLVNDAVAHGKPDAGTGVVRRSNAVFALEVHRGSIPGA